MKLDNIFQQPGNHFDQLSTVLTHMYKYRNYTLGVFVPEATPRETNYTVGIITIWYFNKENLLNARSEAEGISPIINAPSYPAICLKSIKYRNYTLGVFVPEASPRDTNYTEGIISIWYFHKEHILNARSEAEGILPMKNSPFYPAICPKSIK